MPLTFAASCNWAYTNPDDPMRCEPRCELGKVCKLGKCLRVTDASADLGPDGPERDGPKRGDSAAPQDGPKLDLQLDACTLAPDFGPRDASPDFFVLGASCIDGESKSLARCRGCAPADDLDCDGLKAGFGSVQDVWPAQHNPLWVGDGFSGPLKTRWSGTTTSGCGVPASLTWESKKQVIVAKGCTSMSLQQPCAGQVKDPDYLVELRFTVDAIRQPYNWSIYIYFGKSAASRRYCRFEQRGGVANGDPQIQISAAGSAQYKRITALNPASKMIAGQTFLLQAHSYKNLKTAKTSHHCRLLRGDGKLELQNAASSTRATSTFTATPLVLETNNVDVTIDHLRVYDVDDHAP